MGAVVRHRAPLPSRIRGWLSLAAALAVGWALAGAGSRAWEPSETRAGASGLPSADGAAVTATVWPSRPVGRLPELAVSGFNFANFMQVVGFERELGELRIRSIRFPAGNLGDQRDRTPADLDLLRRHWLLLGRPQVVMQARVFGGTPQQAKEAARYAASIGLPVAYWEIGNEPDLYPPAGSWTPEGYCETFRAFVDALRPEAPQARFAGPAVSGGSHKMEWVRRFVFACGDVVDVVTWHVYPTDGTWPENEALATSAEVSSEIERVRSWLQDPATNPRGWRRAGEVGLGVTEFGLSWRSASFRHLADFTAALWTADVAGRLMAGRVELAQYFALQDTGGHGLLDAAGFTRPTYHVFRMLSELRGSVVPVRLDAARPTVSAYAVAGDDGALRVLVVNADASLAFRMRFEDADATPLRLLSADQLTEVSFETYDDVVSLPATLPVPIPPRSVTVVRLAR